jgi:DNA invertase Pin-like site-specific DNA recombinase
MDNDTEETKPLWWRALLLREHQRAAARSAPLGAEHGAKVRQGQERARARGVHVGRPGNPGLTPEALERACAMRASGLHVRDIATAIRVPKSTLHRALTRTVA